MCKCVTSKNGKKCYKIEMLKTCGGRSISRCFSSIIKCSTLKLHTSKCRTFHIYDEFSYAALRLKRPNGQGGNYTVCRLKGNKNLLQCISLKLYPIQTRGRIFVVRIRLFQIQTKIQFIVMISTFYARLWNFLRPDYYNIMQ